jgi:triphosphoribosyl-dephospho-CoA synthase
MPMAAAAGMIRPNQSFNNSSLRRNLKLITESATPEDAVNMYKAIKIANPNGLGKAPDLDINDPASTKRIIHEHVSLYKIFKIAEKYDNICSEWVNNYPITFNLAYPTLKQQLQTHKNIDQAIIHTFLKVLAEHPDTLIARKTSNEKAQQISNAATEILKNRFEKTDAAKKLKKLDRQLRKSSNLLNPGTTADIIAAALALAILNGYRP